MEGTEDENLKKAIKNIVGGFLFLRFICPAITAPQLYGLTDAPPSSANRRVLVLVTKLLFNSSTSVYFESKQAHLMPLNKFIEENSPRLELLFQHLTSPKEGDIETCFAADCNDFFVDVGSAQKKEDFEVLKSMFTANMENLEEHIGNISFDFLDQVKNALEEDFEGKQHKTSTLGDRLRNISRRMRFRASGIGF